ncbi:MAG: hypothetical protein HN921_02675 [Bacteroidetes bacterium]|jgi:hypothetical protein|nr:hypothetical protein [Deltaproteobacteria bacterium]MBT7038725.1 hypothetical protein [Bacteroidota bacterium]
MKIKLIDSFVKSIIIGSGFGIGLITTLAIGVTVSTTFTSGDALTADAMNIIKSAIESIPNWTKGSNGYDAAFDGKIEINLGTALTGTASTVSGTKTVTGSSTNFDTALTVGDYIAINEEVRMVTTITDASNIEVDIAFEKTSTNDFISSVGMIVKNGNLGIGSSKPSEKLFIADDGDADLDLWTANDNTTSQSDYSTIHFKYSGGSLSTPSDVKDGNNLGKIEGQGYYNTRFYDAAAVYFEIDGVPGIDDMPGRIEFHTTPDGASAKSERMRITNEGFVGIGSTSPSSALYVDTDPGDNRDALKIRQEDTSSTQDAIDIINTSAGNSIVINSDQFVVDTDGKVGIGSLPNARLEVDTDPGENVDALWVDQGDTTNNPAAIRVTNAGTGNSIEIGTNDFVVTSTGSVGIGTLTPTTSLDISGDAIRIKTSKTPASIAASCNTGEISWDINMIYVCVSNNSWKGASLATW